MSAKRPTPPKAITTLIHDEARRTNIPTAEYQSVIDKETEDPVRVAYPRNVAGLDDEKATRTRDLDPQLVWRGKDELDWSDLVVQAPPLYIQEKVHPKVLIDDLRRQSVASGPSPVAGEGTGHQSPDTGHRQLDLFADFNGIPEGADRTEFYMHDQNWSNRMILGDSLQVMASLAEREGLRGRVQCIYIDPPYGIKFNSNFQWSTTSRDVKDGNAAHITREPEQVKAFRDTWRDGIHSYLTYLRDRLTVARDLLTESGSVFVQIGDENVHRVRALMDEVFGEDNFVSAIAFIKTTSATSEFVPSTFDYLLWFGKDRSRLKYRQVFRRKTLGEEGTSQYVWFRTPNMEDERIGNPQPDGSRVFAASDMKGQSGGESTQFVSEVEGSRFHYGKGGWKTNGVGMARALKASRLKPIGKSLMYRRYLDDFAVYPVTNMWVDVLSTGFSDQRFYVVQTGQKVIERCILMTTDPGDLVLDPTCGSGTTAYVAEQWGRRWITVDTSRVALALARARIMGARYPYYLLADSPEGQQKEAEVTRAAPSIKPTYGDIRHGFVYERVPHITLKSIANNAEIDVIWEEYEEKLRPLREQLTEVAGVQWLVAYRKGKRYTVDVPDIIQGWEVPREVPADWPPATGPLVTSFWQLRMQRQKEIDASIAARADYEYLYDRPYSDNKKVRVAGPFTVESLSPHRMLGVDEDGELIDSLHEPGPDYDEGQSFVHMILDNLRTSGVQQAHKDDRITFTSLTPWPGDLVCAEGRYVAGGQVPVVSDQSPTPTGHQPPATDHRQPATETRAAIFIGPEFGTVTRPDLVEAAREARESGFDVLIACAFNYDAMSSELAKLGALPILKARMNADLHMATDLKNTGSGNLFVVFGEPDVDVTSGQWLVTSNGRMVANFDRFAQLSGLGSLEELNRLGRTNLPRFKELSLGGTLRVDQPAPAGGGFGGVEHRGGGGEGDNRRISSVPGNSERVAGGGGDTDHPGSPPENAEAAGRTKAADARGDNWQDVERPQALTPGSPITTNHWPLATVSAIRSLTPADFPLALTTGHWAQVTVRGVDIFRPSTGKVEASSADDIACWFIDSDYNEESFFVRQAYFLGANDPYKALKTTLKAEINEDAWASLHSDTSRPFERPKGGRIAVKVINHLGDEVMKVFRV